MARGNQQLELVMASAVGSAVSALVTALLITVVLAAQRAHAVLPSPATVPQGRRKRRWWARERSACWWDTEAQDFDDKEFRSNFRMCWETFYFVADTIRPQIQRQDTTWRPALGFQRVTAMALYRLATGAHNAALQVLLSDASLRRRHRLPHYCKLVWL
jgi:hypothetical protein